MTVEDHDDANHLAACAMGCEAMLRAMLTSGQHYWRLPAAEQIAKGIGMTTPVRKGIA